MATPADVALIRAANAGLVRLATRDLQAFWASLNLDRPEAARDALLRFMPELTARYGEAAAVVAADFYDDLREAEPVRPGFRARMADPVPAEAVQQRTRFGAQHLFTDAPDQTLVFLASAATKYVLRPGWDTLTESAKADPAAVGWHRETRPGACDFCRMLAGRGGVYKESTVRFAAHDDCGCVAVPSWDASAPEVDVMAYVASERTSRMTPTQREAHNERVRDWMARNL